MFNKLRQAIKLAEEAEFEEIAVNYLIIDENFDFVIEDYLNEDIEKEIQEDLELFGEADEVELDDVLEDEYDDEVALEDLLESMMEDF